LATLAVKLVIPLAKAGLSVPLLRVRALKSALLDAALVTVTVYVLAVTPS